MRKILLAAPTAVMVSLAWWEGLQSRSSTSAHYSVGAMVVVALALAVALGIGRQKSTTATWARSAKKAAMHKENHDTMRFGWVLWAVLIVAIVGWDANSFAHQSHNLPTLSYYFGRITRYHWGRGVVFFIWLAIGGYLALGNRRASQQ